SISDELIEDAFNLSPSGRCGIEVLEDSVQVRSAIRGLFYISDQILLSDVRLPFPAGPLPGVLHLHGSSLLTSTFEEHDSFAAVVIGRRVKRKMDDEGRPLPNFRCDRNSSGGNVNHPFDDRKTKPCSRRGPYFLCTEEWLESVTHYIGRH